MFAYLDIHERVVDFIGLIICDDVMCTRGLVYTLESGSCMRDKMSL